MTARRLHAAQGRDQDLPHHVVVGGVILELLAQPSFKSGDEKLKLLIIILRQEQRAPHVDGMLHITGLAEQAFNGALPFLGVVIVQKIFHLAAIGSPADHVEIDTAEKLGVIGRRRRLDLFRGKAGVDERIDPRRQGPGAHCRLGNSRHLLPRRARVGVRKRQPGDAGKAQHARARQPQPMTPHDRSLLEYPEAELHPLPSEPGERSANCRVPS